VPTEPVAGDHALNGRLHVAIDATPLLARPTGVGVFCNGIFSGLAARDDVAVSAFAVSWRRRNRVGALVPPDVATRQRPMPARPLHWAWQRTNQPPLELFIGRADVVHGTNFVVPPTARAAEVLTIHDLTFIRFPQFAEPATLEFPGLIRRALRRGAWVHTHSTYIAQEVIETFGVAPERVRAVAAGAPRSPDDATGPADAGDVARLLPPGTRRWLLSIGTTEPRKDLSGLVAAFDEVARSRDDVALVLVGPPGWGTDSLEAAIARSGARDRIVRTGWVDEATKDRLLRRATVLAYPSIYEGFGFPPLEAMAAGVPVVATRAGSLPEVLGDAALLVDVGDTAGLASALGTVLDSPHEADTLVARGRARAGQFTWERCAQGLVSLYRDARADR
jgi:glycosyltransferase involved in cell wall biosynthesis